MQPDCLKSSLAMLLYVSYLKLCELDWEISYYNKVAMFLFTLTDFLFFLFKNKTGRRLFYGI